MPLALVALALGAFAIGTTEFVAIGLLPDVATDLSVSIPTAGWLVTGYALGVVVGAPLLTLLCTGVPRRTMLLALMAIFVVGNVLTAVAPTFGFVVVGRLVASLAHGAFFGIGSVVAAGLVAPQKRAGAIAIMFTGLTLANVVGVPVGTWVGQTAGWRVTFGLVALLGVLGFIGVARLVPQLPAAGAVRVRNELAALRQLQVLLAMAMTVLGFGGVFAAITYLAPMMTEVAGYSPGAVTGLLVLLGVGMVIGNLLGGQFADRALMPSLAVTLGALTVVLAAFTFTAHAKAPAAVTIVLIGVLGFATVPPLQKRVLDQASAAPTLASAVNVGAFNLGNALAAGLGGGVIAAGFGYTAPSWVGAAMAGSALVVALASWSLERRTRLEIPAALDAA